MKSIVKRCMAFMMALFLAGGMVLNSSGIVFAAESGTSGDYEYQIVGGTYIEITDYNGSAKSIDIPSKLTVGGVSYPVKSIGQGAFADCHNLTSITIPSSVMIIEYEAFSGCSSLTSISIPASVIYIGHAVFAGCDSLSNIEVDANNMKYDNRENCNAIIETSSDSLLAGCRNTIIPSSVTSIGWYAFSGCSSLTSITIPSSVTSIQYEAFRDCKNLTSITISDSVTRIGEGAFSDCSSLTSITIPSSVTSIEYEAFSGCSSLTSITILSSVTSIGWGAFLDCRNLMSITIPSSVTSIGSYTFSGCSSLTSITIPSSVTSIGSYTFSGCSSLTSITIPANVTSIGANVFSGCSSLTSITIPANVTSIGANAFSGCSSLTSITISDSVTSIGANAFSGCSSLTSITIPSSVTSIGEGAFSGCSSLTSITIPSSVTSIGDSAFSGCSSLTSITIPSSVTSIQYEAFRDCKNLTSITISDSVTSIGWGAFHDCRNLTSITIPSSVTSIGGSAFSGCSSLMSITIPSSVTSIGGSAFSGCSSLMSITIPSSVTSIGEGAFSDCSSLMSITIPNSVTSIESGAFGGCSSLTSIIIPNSVTSIGYHAFSGCSSLTSITIPNSVTSIESGAFRGCSSLTSIIIPDSVTSIEYEAFRDCSSLTIYGNKNSYAATYAKNHSIPFKVIGEGGWIPGSTGKNNVYYINSVDANQIMLDAFAYGYDASKVSMESFKPYVGKYAYIEFDTSNSSKVIGVQGVKSSIGTITEYAQLNSSGGNDSVEIDHKEYQVGSKGISIIDGRNSRVLYHTINDKIVGIEFLKTSIGYYNRTTENGEGNSITISNKEYNINSASCISDNVKSEKLVVFSVGSKNNSDKISPFLFEMQELEGTPSVWVYVSDDTFSTEIGQELDLYCALHIGDYVIPDWEKPSFAIGNEKLVKLSNYEQTDLGYHCKIKGVSVGQTTLTITDTQTGAHQSFPITVKEKSEAMSYTCRINEVPDYTIESGWDKGLQTNIYNVNGLYVNKYKYGKNKAGGYDVSFDVYNTLYMHGSVDVYDKDGRWIQSAKINKRTGITSLYATEEALLYLIDDAVQKKTFTYEATTYTKKTGIKISVPDDGYFVISTNYADSPGVMLYNSIDMIMLGLDAAGSAIDKVDYNFNLEKYLSDAKEKQLHEVLQKSIESKTKKFLSDQLKEGLTAGYGDAANAIVLQGNEILTAEKLDGNFYKDVIGVGWDALQNYMGPAGAALKVMFGIEKYTDYTIQTGQICKGLSKSGIAISTTSAPIIHGITVKPENPAAVGEAVLQIFRVSEQEDLASSFENAVASHTDQYEIYNICFTKDNVEQEINTNVTVRIPIPKAFDKNKSSVYRQEKDGSWTKLNAKIDGNYLVFETNHFSLYAIANTTAGGTTVLVSSITLNMKKGAVAERGTLQLNAAVAPSNAANKMLLWSSDKPSIATVDQTGLVTAVRAGKATITVKAQDGSGIEASCVVEVTGTSSGGSGNSGGGSSSGGGNSSGGGSSSSGGNSSGGGNSSASGNGSATDEPTIKILYYIVNFNKNGGKNLSRQKMTLLQNDSLGILPKVERKNYKFLGWYTQPVDGKKVSQKTVLNGSTTLYARWGKITKPSKEQITSLKSGKAGTMVVKYKKYSGIKGYEIVYSTSKKFTAASTKRVIAGSAEKTLKKLKTGTTYYVKVRAYRVDSTGRKIYGAYSKVRNVRVK